MAGILIALGSTALFVAAYCANAVYLRRIGRARRPTGRSLGDAFAFATGIFLSVIAISGAGPIAAVILGAVCNTFAVGRMVQVNRRDLRVHRLLARLREPDAGAALAALEYEVEGLRGGRGGEKSDYETRVRAILGIAVQTGRAGYQKRALAWTMRIEAGVLGRQTAAMHAQVEAGLHVALNDRAGARKAIARAPRPALAPWENALAALEALLEAIDGDAQAATDRAVRALAARSNDPTRLTWQMARAHATARLGAAQDAEDALLSMRREGGDAVLRRVVRQDGPASPIAERLLSEQGAYR